MHIFSRHCVITLDGAAVSILRTTDRGEGIENHKWCIKTPVFKNALGTFISEVKGRIINGLLWDCFRIYFFLAACSVLLN